MINLIWIKKILGKFRREFKVKEINLIHFKKGIL